MANTFTKIQTITVGSGGQTTVSFTSIPQTYSHLKFLISTKDTTDTPTDGLLTKVNSDTNANYSYKGMEGVHTTNTPTFTSQLNTTSFQPSVIQPGTYTASVFGNLELNFYNYTSSLYKITASDYVVENNAQSAVANGFRAGLWSSSSAITSVLFTAPVNYAQYSTFTLYGLKTS
jgi:hypothetical protein